MMHKPRILIVVSAEGSEEVERHLSLLSRELVNRGYSVGVACPAGSRLTTKLSAGIVVHPLTMRSFISPGSLFRLVTYARGYDVLHGHLQPACLYVKWVTRLLRKKAVYTGHSTDTLSHLPRRGCIIAVSRDVEEDLREKGYRNVCRVYQGEEDSGAFRVEPFNHDMRNGSSHDASPICVGMLVKKDKEPGIDVLLDAVALMKHLNLQLLLANEDAGESSQKLRDRIDRESLPVRLMGKVEDAGAFFRNLDILVASGGQEVGSCSLLQSVSCALPIIAGDQGNLSEIVMDGSNGFLVPAQDPKRLADKIEKLVEDPALRRQFGSNSRSLYLRKFSLECMMDHLGWIYANVLQ